ncbi:helix-turn-helix domain-containing protein [Winogradskyella ursingii]|uniref:helix-turn-helix domain-containing protein n=1 Tax=Winogradskyella ursingii TaxID=2686079 RepID=UPI0015CD1D7F|nr:helix-turn-helix domain-containing protein [Winogradskyella ursingii]
MTLKYYDTNSLSHLAFEIFSLCFSEKVLPFESHVLPNCNTSLTFIYGKKQSVTSKKQETKLNGLMLTGQFYKSYEFSVKETGTSFGIILKPTALYKLTKQDISQINNKHLPLLDFSKMLHEILNPIFVKHENNFDNLYHSLCKMLLKIPLEIDKKVQKIDQAIASIHAKNGMLNATDLSEEYDQSQKSLETQFKKIVGLTPGKYIRTYRFLNLMRKFESNQIDLKDLIYSYDYYDHSHFSKDFKYFMNQSPRDYFETDNFFLNEYLSK